MANEQLKIHARPKLADGRMVLAFSGWMNGGDVSTGTVDYLTKTFHADRLAEIEPDDFYIYNFPGSMEISSLFRPHGKIEDGLVRTFQPPSNTFSCSEDARLVLFAGEEPNVKWRKFADCIFDVACQTNVSMIYFVGSVGGVVPHTRESRLFSSVSDARHKSHLEACGVRFGDYEGPVSLVTYMMTVAEQKGFGMATLVAEIPPYIQGRNPKSIIAVMRKLAVILGLQIDVDDLRKLTGQWESRINKAVQERPELVKHIRKLEADYDNEIFDTQMGDLKDWLEQQGIRVD